MGKGLAPCRDYLLSENLCLGRLLFRAKEKHAGSARDLQPFGCPK
jgi:hypothetical protein